MKSIKRETLVECLFYAALFTILFLWALMQKYGAPPDEVMRYSIPQYIVNHGSLPKGWEDEVLNRQWGFSYAFQPILPYMFSALSMKIMSFFTENGYLILIAARFVNVIFGMIMAVYVRKISKRLFKTNQIQWMFTLFVTFLPQSMFMHTYVNTDSMALLASAMIVYGWICGLERKWDFRSSMHLSAGIIFCALSYYNAYGFILCSMLLFIFSFLYKSSESRKLSFDWRSFLMKGIPILLVVMAGAGWWFVRSYILYDGDFLGMRIRDDFGNKYGIDLLKPDIAKTYRNVGFSIFYMLTHSDYIVKTAMSFIGMFGAMSIVLFSWMYWGYGLIIGAGAAGLFLRTKKKHHRCKEALRDETLNKETLNKETLDKETLNKESISSDTFSIKGESKVPQGLRKHLILFRVQMALCVAIPIILCTWAAYAVDYQPQGRYILPMLIPFMYFIALGIEKITEAAACKSIGKLPVAKIIPCGICFWFIAVMVVIMAKIIFQIYYPEFIAGIKMMF